MSAAPARSKPRPRSAPKTRSDISADSVEIALRSRYNPIRGLTMQSLVTQLDNFDLGYVAFAALTWDKMERRDYMLSTVAPKRRKAVSRLKIEIMTKEASPEAEAHAQALREFYDNLTAVNALDENEVGGASLLIRQMMDCIGKKYAVHEIVWQPGEVLTAEFRFTPLWFCENRSGKLRFLPVPLAGAEGVEMEPGGWLVTKGDGLMEVCSILYTLKNLPFKDWVSYSGRFGTPGTVGQTSAAKGSPEGNAMREAVRRFNQDFACVIYGANGAIKEPISLIQAGAAGDLPFPPLVELCDRAMAMLWRGSDLSTMSADNKGASVQGDEAETLLVDDAKLVSEALNIQVDRWVIWQKFGVDRPLANAELVVPQKQDVALDIQVDNFLLNAGAKLGARERMEHYGRPEIEDGDEPLHAPVVTSERVTDALSGKKTPGDVPPTPTDLPNEGGELLDRVESIFRLLLEALNQVPEDKTTDKP